MPKIAELFKAACQQFSRLDPEARSTLLLGAAVTAFGAANGIFFRAIGMHDVASTDFVCTGVAAAALTALGALEFSKLTHG